MRAATALARWRSRGRGTAPASAGGSSRRTSRRARRRLGARSALRVERPPAGRLASNPLFHAGWPQQVAPFGPARLDAAARSTAGVSRTDLQAETASPRQVGNNRPRSRSVIIRVIVRFDPHRAAGGGPRDDRPHHLRSAVVRRRRVLDDVSAIVRPRDRTRPVGRNGAGKTTLLRLLAGELHAGAGRDLGHRRDPHCAPRPAPPLSSEITPGRVRRPGGGRCRATRGRAAGARARMAEPANRARGDAALRRRTTRLRARGGYGWRSRLESVARGLGFSPEDLERPLRSFSGGELTRASLTRALAAEPDVLLLDEPTNHLDTDAIEWLEEHIDSLDAAVLFVSHDRWFLESVANGVLLIERGQGRFEKGTYSHFAGLRPAAGLAGRRVRPPAGRARPSPEVRGPVPLRHQIPAGAVQAEGDGSDRAGREGQRPKVAAVRVPSSRPQRPGCARLSKRRPLGRRPDTGKRERRLRSSGASGLP